MAAGFGEAAGGVHPSGGKEKVVLTGRNASFHEALFCENLEDADDLQSAESSVTGYESLNFPSAASFAAQG